MDHLPPSVSHSSSDLRPLFLQIRTEIASTTITEDTSFSINAGILNRSAMVYTRRKIKEPSTIPALTKNPPSRKNRTSDQQGSKCDGNHSLSDTDIYGFL